MRNHIRVLIALAIVVAIMLITSVPVLAGPDCFGPWPQAPAFERARMGV